MKNFFDSWKKYLTEGLKVDDAKKELDLTQKDSQLKLQLAQAKLANAQAEEKAEKAEQEAIKNAEMQKSSSPVNPRLVGGSTGTSSTSPTLGEANGIGFTGSKPEGSVANTPGDSPDKPNVNKEEITLSEDDVGLYEGEDEDGKSCYMEMSLEEGEECGCESCNKQESINEAKYQGRSVKLNKPMRGDVKKYRVFVRDPSTGNVKKVNFGDKKMRIKRNNPKRRKSFRARHNCANPGPKTKAKYWSCKFWSNKPVSELV